MNSSSGSGPAGHSGGGGSARVGNTAPSAYPYGSDAYSAYTAFSGDALTSYAYPPPMSRSLSGGPSALDPSYYAGAAGYGANAPAASKSLAHAMRLPATASVIPPGVLTSGAYSSAGGSTMQQSTQRSSGSGAPVGSIAQRLAYSSAHNAAAGVSGSSGSASYPTPGHNGYPAASANADSMAWNGDGSVATSSAVANSARKSAGAERNGYTSHSYGPAAAVPAAALPTSSGSYSVAPAVAVPAAPTPAVPSARAKKPPSAAAIAKKEATAAKKEQEKAEKVAAAEAKAEANGATEEKKPRRVDLLARKAVIDRVLGTTERRLEYWFAFESFLLHRMEKEEMDGVVMECLGANNVHLHNDFVLSVMQNACSDDLPPKPSKHRNLVDVRFSSSGALLRADGTAISGDGGDDSAPASPSGKKRDKLTPEEKAARRREREAKKKSAGAGEGGQLPPLPPLKGRRKSSAAGGEDDDDDNNTLLGSGAKKRTRKHSVSKREASLSAVASYLASVTSGAASNSAPTAESQQTAVSSAAANAVVAPTATAQSWLSHQPVRHAASTTAYLATDLARRQSRLFGEALLEYGNGAGFPSPASALAATAAEADEDRRPALETLSAPHACPDADLPDDARSAAAFRSWARLPWQQQQLVAAFLGVPPGSSIALPASASNSQAAMPTAASPSVQSFGSVSALATSASSAASIRTAQHMLQEMFAPRFGDSDSDHSTALVSRASLSQFPSTHLQLGSDLPASFASVYTEHDAALAAIAPAAGGWSLDPFRQSSALGTAMNPAAAEPAAASALISATTSREAIAQSLISRLSLTLPSKERVKMRVYESALHAGVERVDDAALELLQAATERHLRSIVSAILDFADPADGQLSAAAADSPARLTPLLASAAAAAVPIGLRVLEETSSSAASQTAVNVANGSAVKQQQEDAPMDPSFSLLSGYPALRSSALKVEPAASGRQSIVKLEPLDATTASTAGAASMPTADAALPSSLPPPPPNFLLPFSLVDLLRCLRLNPQLLGESHQLRMEELEGRAV